MIDIHNHILPGIDDGSKTEKDSINLAKAAVDEGISTIIATPHHRNGIYDNERDSIIKYVELLNELLKQEGIPVDILPGQETRINGDMLKELEEGKIQPLNDTKYVFVEFPFSSFLHYSEKLLLDLQVKIYISIIDPPARYSD